MPPCRTLPFFFAALHLCCHSFFPIYPYHAIPHTAYITCVPALHACPHHTCHIHIYSWPSYLTSHMRARRYHAAYSVCLALPLLPSPICYYHACILHILYTYPSSPSRCCVVLDRLGWDGSLLLASRAARRTARASLAVYSRASRLRCGLYAPLLSFIIRFAYRFMARACKRYVHSALPPPPSLHYFLHTFTGAFLPRSTNNMLRVHASVTFASVTLYNVYYAADTLPTLRHSLLYCYCCERRTAHWRHS